MFHSKFLERNPTFRYLTGAFDIVVASIFFKNFDNKTIEKNPQFRYTFDPFVPNAPFLYPINRKVLWYFQGRQKECIGNEWVKQGFTFKN